MTGLRDFKRRILAASILVLGPLLIAGCGAEDHSRLVEIAKTWSYHTPQCSRVFMARTTEVTKAQALALGLHPCPLCKPDSRQ